MKKQQDKMSLKRRIKQAKGITLIALVVTIIVLLILAGISISMLTGQNGILNRANEAKEKTESASDLEYLQTEAYAALMTYYDGNQTLSENEYVLKVLGEKNGSGITTNVNTGKVTYKGKDYDISEILGKSNEQKALADSKIEQVTDSDLMDNESIRMVVKDESGTQAVIPVGFYYVTGTPSTGMVISDINGDNDQNSKGGNQFVWVPCNGAGVTYEKENGLATTWRANYSSKQNYYTVTPEVKNDKGEVTSPSEPITDWADQGGNLESVKTYGGFYVARYEAGLPSNMYENRNGVAYSTNGKKNIGTTAPVSKKNTASWNYISQENAVKASNKMYAESENYGVTSSLVDSYAWDTVVEWIKGLGKSVVDSTSYGNYYNKSFSLKNVLYAKHTYYSGNGKKQGEEGYLPAKWTMATTYNKGDLNTGDHDAGVTNTTWRYEVATGAIEDAKVNNIYDMAGNMWEWTTETGYHNGSTTEYAVRRGGSFYDSGSDSPVSFRNGDYRTVDYYIDFGFRVVLYVK